VVVRIFGERCKKSSINSSSWDLSICLHGISSSLSPYLPPLKRSEISRSWLILNLTCHCGELLSSSLHISANCLLNSLLKANPVAVSIALSVPLGMHNNGALLKSNLGVEGDGDFESASRSWIFEELKSELSWVFCLNAISDRFGILAVSSSSTVLDGDVVRSSLAAFKLGCWLAGSHAFYSKRINRIIFVINKEETG
jgi:hypothetical protein